MKTQQFWHSLEEKTDLLEKYLLTLDVNEVSYGIDRLLVEL